MTYLRTEHYVVLIMMGIGIIFAHIPEVYQLPVFVLMLLTVEAVLIAMAVTVIVRRVRRYYTQPRTNLRLCKVLEMGRDGVLRKT